MAAKVLTLSERVYKSRDTKPGDKAVPTRCKCDEGRWLYKQWSEEQMKKAVDAVVISKLSVRNAAMQYNVPKSTLGDRISGRVQLGAVSGPAKYLTLSEESELSRFLSRCCQIGYACSKQEVLALVQRILDSKGMKVNLSHGWWDSFRKRHPEFVLRVPAPVSQARSKATDPDVFSRYFDLLEDTIKENRLHGKPGQMFNMDESGMPLDPGSPKLVFEKGCRASSVCTGEKTQITVVACASAAGFALPPMVIWDRQTLSPELTIGEVPGTVYGLSKKGWIDCELFDAWFNNHFLRYAPTARPVLLMLDGHSSHYCPDTIKLAAKHQVILFALPPNTTHISQPLDKGCFSPLKEAWKQVCHNFLTANPGMVVTRYQFSRLFSQAWMQSMTISNITSGFKITGIYPTDRQAILKLIPDSHSRIQEESGLAFIPLISPSIKSKCSKSTEATIATEDSPSNMSKSSKNTEATNAEDQSYESEEKLFEKWYKTNANITTNDRYNAWLKENHPDYVWMKPLCSTGVEQFLSLPEPPYTIPVVKPKSCGRVLTSDENIEILTEKEKAKKTAQIEREERKKAREAKRLEKEAEKEAKRIEKETEKGINLRKTGKSKKPPIVSSEKSSSSATPQFTAAEIALYKKRLEEGYDITTDVKYNAWVKLQDTIAKPKDHQTEDSNSKKYCICKKESYGRMIGCDNKNCPMEWFHFKCVGLAANTKPKGKWYCPMCETNGKKLNQHYHSSCNDCIS